MRKGMLLAALLLAAGMASASDARVDVSNGVSFADQKQKILLQLADGESYSEISKDDRGKVLAALGRMQDILDAGGLDASVATVTAQQRLDLLNDQELVNNILTQAGEDSRMVCRREAPVGTRLARTQCLTVAARRRQREEAQRNMDAQSRGMEGVFTR